MGFSTGGAVAGLTAGTFVSGLVGVVFIWVIYRHIPKPYSHKLEVKAYLSTMFAYALPLSFANIVTGLLPSYYSFLLPIHYATDSVIIGNYGVAMNLVVLLTFFSMPTRQ